MNADNSNNTSLAPVTSLVSGLVGLFICGALTVVVCVIYVIVFVATVNSTDDTTF